MAVSFDTIGAGFSGEAVNTFTFEHAATSGADVFLWVISDRGPMSYSSVTYGDTDMGLVGTVSCDDDSGALGLLGLYLAQSAGTGSSQIVSVSVSQICNVSANSVSYTGTNGGFDSFGISSGAGSALTTNSTGVTPGGMVIFALAFGAIGDDDFLTGLSGVGVGGDSAMSPSLRFLSPTTNNGFGLLFGDADWAPSNSVDTIGEFSASTNGGTSVHWAAAINSFTGSGDYTATPDSAVVGGNGGYVASPGSAII